MVGFLGVLLVCDDCWLLIDGRLIILSSKLRHDSETSWFKTIGYSLKSTLCDLFNYGFVNFIDWDDDGYGSLTITVTS